MDDDRGGDGTPRVEPGGAPSHLFTDRNGDATHDAAERSALLEPGM